MGGGLGDSNYHAAAVICDIEKLLLSCNHECPYTELIRLPGYMYVYSACLLTYSRLTLT